MHIKSPVKHLACLATLACASTAAAGVPDGPDVTLCELYGLTQFGKSGDIRAFSLATTSWNIGNKDFAWFNSPDWRHPHIIMNVYRKDANGRFLQIGQSWIKHGFFALSNTQCGGSCTFEPGNSGGDWLGQNCTDTYSVFNNAAQWTLGPRYEVNPWEGTWDYEGSVFDVGGPSNTPIRRRLQVRDGDLNPANHPGSEFFYEGYYVHFEDIEAMNSVAWQPFTPFRNGQGDYSFSQPSSNDSPNIGFAWDAANYDTTAIVAEQLPIVEFESPDGRSAVLSSAIDLGNGQWRYEYAISNIDMDRQVGTFSVPVPAGVNVSDVGFHAVFHHDEPFNARPDQGGIAITNDAWPHEVSGGSITWSTANNPIRWGTMYNFWFTADAAPTDADATIGLFRDVADVSRPDTLPGLVRVPSAPTPTCDGDLDGDSDVDSDDLGVLLGAFGSGTAGDIDGDNDTDSDDLGILLGAFGQPC